MIWLVDLPRAGSPVGRLRAADAVHQGDFHPVILAWVEPKDARNTSLSPLREARTRSDFVLAVFNFTPILRPNYGLGAPRPGQRQWILNSDAQVYGGRGQGKAGGAEAGPVKGPCRTGSLRLTRPPLAAWLFISRGAA